MVSISMIDIFVLSGTILLAFILSLTFEVSYFVVILLFFGIPCLWLSIRRKEDIKAAALFAILFGAPLAIAGDYLGIVNGTWIIPSSIFPVRIFSHVPIEDVLLVILFVYDVVMLSALLEAKRLGMLRVKRLVLTGMTLCLLALSISMIPAAYLFIPYAYFWIGMCIMVIPILLVLRKRILLPALSRLTVCVFVPLLVFEALGLLQGYWQFSSGEYIGWVNIFSLSFPIEELVFWIILAGPAFICFLELFKYDSTLRRLS